MISRCNHWCSGPGTNTCNKIHQNDPVDWSPLSKYLRIWFLRLKNCMREHFSFFHTIKIYIFTLWKYTFVYCAVLFHSITYYSFILCNCWLHFFNTFFFSTHFCFSADNCRSYLHADLPPHFKSDVTKVAAPESFYWKAAICSLIVHLLLIRGGEGALPALLLGREEWDSEEELHNFAIKLRLTWAWM